LRYYEQLQKEELAKKMNNNSLAIVVEDENNPKLNYNPSQDNIGCKLFFVVAGITIVFIGQNIDDLEEF
jgi:hypothetical protein